MELRRYAEDLEAGDLVLLRGRVERVLAAQLLPGRAGIRLELRAANMSEQARAEFLEHGEIVEMARPSRRG